MKVSDIVKYAVTSELKTLAVGDVGNTSARSEKQLENLDTVLGYIHQGLIALHEVFPITINIEDVDLSLGDTDPIAMPEYAMYLYKAVRKSDGTEVPINQPFYREAYAAGEYEGLYLTTSSINTFTIEGKIVNNEEVAVTYVVAPTPVKFTDKINLPFNFLEALLNYVAYKAHISIKATPNTEQTNYLRMFKESCAKLKEVTDNTYEITLSSKFASRGFV